MKQKKLLIIERCNSNLQMLEESIEGQSENSIVLTGLFTTFGSKNRNGRIYESADFLPHVEALREQIEDRRLLGELDHPHSFETSLANVSHVVESLEFDPQQNAIIGKIRLLNTSKGKEAQALIKDGIPLNISSRAAGTVDESGHVRLQQLFTYDLVADPGFANAQLKRVNESYGFGDDDGIEIYEINEDANTNLDPNVSKTADCAEPQAVKNEDTLNNNNMEDNNKQEFIQYSDFQKYSEHLSEIMGELQSAIANIKDELSGMRNTPAEGEIDSSHVDNSQIADLIAKVGEIEKLVKTPTDGAAVVDVTGNASDDKVAEIESENATLKEQVTNLVSYVKYLAETLDKSITHQDYMAEETNKIIAHNNYLAENMNKMIDHQDYLAENINDTIAYQNYVAEMLDKSIDYSNMLAEEQNKTIAHADYLAENMNKMIEHQDYIVEEVNKVSENILVENNNVPAEENKPVEENKTDETVDESNVPTNENNVSTDENNVPTDENKPVEENKTEDVQVETKPAFDAKSYQSELNEKLTNLLNTVKSQYEERKKAEEEAIKESKKNVDTTNFTLINYIPARLQESWMKLSDERKKEILNESKLFVINNEASANYFWNTRDLRESKVELQKIDESATAAPSTPVNENAVSDERLKAMSEKIQRNMRRW